LAGERTRRARAALDAAAASRLSAWIRGYNPLRGIPDELIDAGGSPRPHWLRFLGDLAELPDGGLESRFALATRHIRDTGVSYRIYGDDNERTWPLNPLPLLLSEADWTNIAAGVAQRAELLELILRDLYGDARLISDG
jgi:uncharacterized circularly permuted ATP-grasp superfamily protein